MTVSKAIARAVISRASIFFREACCRLPRASGTEAERAGLQVADTFFFGGDYAITLEKWLQKFDDNLREIRDLGYDDAFIRKWRFYLTGSAATFRSGRINLMQAELAVPHWI